MEKDRDQIILGVQDFVDRMDFVEFLPDDRAAFGSYFMSLMAVIDIEVFVVEHEERIVAGLGLFYSPLMWNAKVMHIEELFWWAAPDAPITAAMRVLTFAMRRVKDVPHDGKKLVSFKSLTSSPPGVDKLYEKMGLRKVETSYMGVF